MDRDATRHTDAPPAPSDDGRASHLVGTAVPDIALPATDGRHISLAANADGRVVVYAYPRTALPGEHAFTPDWDTIPGAKGCTPEACGFRDHHAEITSLAASVFGLSTQSTAYQSELVERLGLPFAILSDERLRLADALRLPTFRAADATLLSRLTFVVRDGIIEHVWYPVFPPSAHAADVCAWLAAAPPVVTP